MQGTTSQQPQTAVLATPAPSPAPTAPNVSPTPTPSPAPTAAMGGTLVDLPYDGTAANPGYSVLPVGGSPTAGAPIAGARVFIGPTILTNAVPPAAVPAGFYAYTTNASGNFAATTLPAGHLAMTAYAPPPHVAILHRDLTITAPQSGNWTFFMTAPSAAESAWLVQENVDRALFGSRPVVFDEAAVEAARYWAAFMQNNHYFAHCIPASVCVPGDTTPAPASYGPQDVDPQHRFDYFHGFSSGSEGENIAEGFASWEAVDAAFMAEQSACPNDSPVNCPFTEATGHFLNIIDAGYMWSAFGIANRTSSGAYYDQEFTLLNNVSPSAQLQIGRPLVR